MCSICGMVDYYDKRRLDKGILEKMGKAQKHRGIDASGIYLGEGAYMQHNRLAVMDPENGAQPMTAEFCGDRYTICYNGEIYNSDELRADLKKKGASFKTACDTETVLWSYICYGDRCAEHLNGIFAFCVYDEKEQRMFLARDRFGIKPFYYATVGSTFLFASEVKALLVHPDISHDIDKYGLWQLLFLSPVTAKGSGIFKDISELLPAHCGYYDRNGLHLQKYWSLEAKRLDITADEAAEQTKQLVCDAIERQLISDVPLCTFLSGGLDSSVITAVAAKRYKELGRTLCTYSFEYEDNKKNFHSTLFQPQGDDEYAVFLARELNTDHTVLTVPNKTVAEYLPNAARFRDMPGQADIDSSLLYFCEQIKKEHTVAISGECSDEIFGGYPWFYRKEMLHSGFFPWIHSPFARIDLFDDKLVNKNEGYEYISSIYRESISNCPVCEDDTESMRTSRIATCLSVDYFMTNLLNRKDRMSMASSLEVRVPFADHRILEFVYNVPWEIKFENNVEKALLRNAMKDYLPDKILNRKKSPYPKTHSPEYEQYCIKMLEHRLNSGGALSSMLDKKAYSDLLNAENVTWFGQLMGKAQLIAWLIQFDEFLNEYKVNIV